MTDVDDLLRKTSRTFALAIPMLPSPPREEVGVAYLLFRIIDTFEDGALWPPARRIETMQESDRGELVGMARRMREARVRDLVVERLLRHSQCNVIPAIASAPTALDRAQSSPAESSPAALPPGI